MPTTPDEQAERRFEALLQEVAEPLRRYVRRRCDPTEADDVLAEVALVLWRRLDDVPTHPLPWCYGVAAGVLANQRRATGRRGRLLLRLAREPAPPSTELDTGGPVEEAVSAALARLPEKDREVLRLWAWENLEPREIAVVLGVSANAVSIRLTRAKARLREELAVAGKSALSAGHKPDTNARSEGGAR